MAKQTTYFPYVTNYYPSARSFTNVKYDSNSTNINISSGKDVNSRVIPTTITWKDFN